MSEHDHPHQNHDDMIKQLKRAEGHLKSIVMLEKGRNLAATDRRKRDQQHQENLGV
ncbi:MULTISPECIES: hypothetical protein [Pseudomonas fluorescens group]|uniref:Metal resistance protein n=1 Tax=Pseudomonas fluorescens TaxID=294 RepID=A0A7M2IYV6_PSEFL|nr:hypothetical protein [Pseudomonas fluorescens]QOU02582.1 hypothetical protein IM720_17820 [Pseudomonas fluorescens]